MRDDPFSASAPLAPSDLTDIGSYSITWTGVLSLDPQSAERGSCPPLAPEAEEAPAVAAELLEELAELAVKDIRTASIIDMS